MNAVSEDFFVKNVILNDVTIENTSIALNIWEELPGLKNFIPWECVGHPEEVQLYFYYTFALFDSKDCVILHKV